VLFAYRTKDFYEKNKNHNVGNNDNNGWGLCFLLKAVITITIKLRLNPSLIPPFLFTSIL